ncbi:hypothetical protein QYF61_024119 [Mycteria americana]|uniref:Uncharacterized protein n=1 Tax=Mycteria americana TaxID=33587 RepID=A0AAN7RYA4_MYCAM|nr:hypothetical protein QYF61_024119 [Mycteria americana]
MVEFTILRGRSRAKSKITTLDFMKADFGHFLDLLGNRHSRTAGPTVLCKDAIHRTLLGHRAGACGRLLRSGWASPELQHCCGKGITGGTPDTSHRLSQLSHLETESIAWINKAFGLDHEAQRVSMVQCLVVHW